MGDVRRREYEDEKVRRRSKEYRVMIIGEKQVI